MQRHSVNQVVRAAVGDVPRIGLGYDVSRIEQQFDQAFSRESGLKLLMLSTADGRAIAERSTLDADGRRVAAMANSFLTLGETLARETGLSQADYATVCTTHGNVVLIRIRADKPLTLTAVAGQETNMAALLFNARDCAGRLAQSLRPAAG